MERDQSCWGLKGMDGQRQQGLARELLGTGLCHLWRGQAPCHRRHVIVMKEC